MKERIATLEENFKVLASKHDILSRRLNNIGDHLSNDYEQENSLINRLRDRVSKLENKPNETNDKIHILLCRLESLEKKINSMKKFSLW